MKERLKNEVQTFGRSLLLPIAVMAPIGMILGLSGALGQSYMIEKVPLLGNPILKLIISSLGSISSIIFSNIPLLFAMGVAYGVSKKEKGIAVFSSVISYLTLTIVMNVYLKSTGTLAPAKEMAQLGQGMVLGVQTLKIEAIGGMISGILAAKLTDRFYKLELPLAFAFFSGKKSVPIITFLATIPVGLIIPFIWSFFTLGMNKISFLLMGKYYGVAVYMALNRALIPFGLHHVLSSIVRFTEAGGIYVIDGQTYVGILNAMNKILFELGPMHESWERLMPTFSGYLAGGQMLTTLFRVPAIGLAMYHTAYKENKEITKGIVLTVCLTAILGNVTEPLEFSFLFIAPKLFILYAIACGILTIPIQMLGVSIGYIRGTIFDFGIFGLMYENTHWIQLVLLGIVNFIVFYFMFKYIIIKFDLKTPGREESISNSTLLKEKKWDVIAEYVIEVLGGKENIKNVDNCVTRLRIDVKNQPNLDIEKLKEAGASGAFIPQKNHVHIVFGPHVEFIKNAVENKLN